MSFKNGNYQFKSITVGGTFSVMIDKNDQLFVWGANTNGELGLGDTQPRIQPTCVDSLEGKKITTVGVGSAFAFALGETFRLTESYDNYNN